MSGKSWPELTFEEWAKLYPPKKVTSKPENPVYDDAIETYREAEKIRDNCEEFHECSCTVVEFGGKYYVVWTDSL